MSNTFDLYTPVSVQGVDTLHKATQYLLSGGKSPIEAQLLAERRTSGVALLVGIDIESIASRARWEGLAVWISTGQVCISGSFAGFRALLMRWPVSADVEKGKMLAQALGMPLQIQQEIKWPGSPPNGWGQRSVVMGILNVTPDSFSDGGRFFDPGIAVERALAMIADGADILDVGGESTRPGSTEVSVDEELARVVPVVEAVARQSGVPISIDTYKPEVAAAALDAGAAIINDIAGLRDPDMLKVAVRTGAPAIFMHMQGVPHTMQQNPQYREVVAEVAEWLRLAGERAVAAGVRREQLIADPGVGFGKSTTQNLELLARLSDFRGMGYPVLIGASRKSVVGNVLNLPVDQRVEGTAATVSTSVQEHAEIIRVHDVKQMRRVVDMTQAVVSAAFI